MAILFFLQKCDMWHDKSDPRVLTCEALTVVDPGTFLKEEAKYMGHIGYWETLYTKLKILLK